MEKREFPRIAVTFPVQLMSKDGESPGQIVATGRTIDLSRNGAKLMLDRPLPTSFVGMLNIDMPPCYSSDPVKASPVQAKANLVWGSLLARKDRFRCGIDFWEFRESSLSPLENILRYEEEKSLGIVPASIAPVERRIHTARCQENRRQSNVVVGFTDHRICERRRDERRLKKPSKTVNLARVLKERALYPYQRVYDYADVAEVVCDGKRIVNLTSVDYFNFAQNNEIKKAACDAVNKYGAGNYSSRYSSGYMRIHQELEEKLVKFMGKESILIFNSGYLTNLAVIISILPRKATIFLDQKSHISLYHACQLSQKDYYNYKHNDMEHLENLLKTHIGKPNKWIVTLGVFNTTGSMANLKSIAVLARKYKARIFIDDAHGIGIYGNSSRGTADEQDVLDEIDLIMCPFQMAFGNIGAFLVGRHFLLSDVNNDDIWPYVFTYNIPPVNTVSILKALDILNKEGPQLKNKLWSNVNYLRRNLAELGYEIMHFTSHIIPLFIGEELRMCEFVQFLFDNGVWVQPYYYPAASRGKGTIRITCTAGHTKEQLDKTLQVFADGYDILEKAA